MSELSVSVLLFILQVVVVLSGSMEPGFYRGDILFLHMGRRPVRAGGGCVHRCRRTPCAIIGDVGDRAVLHISSWQQAISRAAVELPSRSLLAGCCAAHSRQAASWWLSCCQLPSVHAAPAAAHAEIVVFNIKDRDIPIVHRAIKVHERASKTPHTDILTKVDIVKCRA